MIKVSLDGSKSVVDWGVVRQVDHARLSSDLAERSTLLLDIPSTVRAEILCAIDHHDDGWQERDLQIEPDPQGNRPRTFDEMSVDEALSIWGRSIDRARGFGLLSAWMVAGHFAYLATLKVGDEQELGRVWAAEREVQREKMLRAWLAQDRFHQTDQADCALACLKLFDSLSLYVIGAGSEPTRRVRLPNGAEASIERRPNGVYSADPWFFKDYELHLSVPGVKAAGTQIVDAWQPEIVLRRNAN